MIELCFLKQDLKGLGIFDTIVLIAVIEKRKGLSAFACSLLYLSRPTLKFPVVIQVPVTLYSLYPLFESTAVVPAVETDLDNRCRYI